MANDDNAAKKNPAATQPMMQMGAISQIRTLVVINQRKNLDGALAFLERNYYQLHLVAKIPDLIKALQTHRPQIVLLSWNLKNADVKRVYRLLTQKFNITCLVFAEDTNTRTTASLMSSGIPNSLLAPVSGPSIHTRIQTMLAPRMRPRKRPVAPDLFKKAIKAAPPESIPQNLGWKEVQDPENPSEKIWQAFDTKDSATQIGNLYFFKGTKPPQFDPIRQSWNYDSSRGGIFIQERVVSPELMAIQEGVKNEGNMEIAKGQGSGGSTPLDKDFDWDKAIALAENEINDVQRTTLEAAPEELGAVQTTPGSEDNIGHAGGPAKTDENLGDIIELGTDIKSRTTQAGESVLALSLRSALLNRPGRANTVKKDKIKVSKMTVCTVASSRFCGYIVCVSNDDTYQKNYMQELMNEFAQLMAKNGESLSRPLEVLEVEVAAVPFGPWTENKAEFSISSKRAGLSLAFFSTAEQPQVIEALDDSVLGISLEKDMRPDTQVTFDVFIHLPKNDKYLLYLSKEQMFTKSMLQKFIGFGVKNLFIRKTEKEQFLAYCARNFITSTLK